MNCPKCNARVSVNNSVSWYDKVYRHRKCKSCGFRFYTEENILKDSSIAAYALSEKGKIEIRSEWN